MPCVLPIASFFRVAFSSSRVTTRVLHVLSIVALCLGAQRSGSRATLPDLPGWNHTHGSICVDLHVEAVYVSFSECYALCAKKANCSQFAVTNNYINWTDGPACNLAPPCAHPCNTTLPWRPGENWCKNWDTYTCPMGPAARCGSPGPGPPTPAPPPTPPPPPPPKHLLVIGSSDGNVYGLRVDNGAKVWSYATNPHEQIISNTVSDAGNVYVGNIDGGLYALNGRNGSLLWKWQNPAPYPPNGVTSPTIYDGVIYVGSIGDYRLWAIDERTGRLRWVSNSSGCSIFGPPIIYKDTVIVATAGYEVTTFALKDGSLVWQHVHAYGSVVGIALYEGDGGNASVIVGSNGGSDE